MVPFNILKVNVGLDYSFKRAYALYVCVQPQHIIIYLQLYTVGYSHTHSTHTQHTYTRTAHKHTHTCILYATPLWHRHRHRVTRNILKPINVCLYFIYFYIFEDWQKVLTRQAPYWHTKQYKDTHKQTIRKVPIAIDHWCCKQIVAWLSQILPDCWNKWERSPDNFILILTRLLTNLVLSAFFLFPHSAFLV